MKYARQYQECQIKTIDNNTLTVGQCPWATEEDVHVNSEHVEELYSCRREALNAQECT